MRRKKLDKKLTLSRETLKNLDTREIRKAAGGDNPSGTTEPQEYVTQCLCPRPTRDATGCLC